MSPWSILKSSIAGLALAQAASAVTIYSLAEGVTPTAFLAPDGTYTGLPAFDPVQHTPPAPPAPPIPTGVSLNLANGDVPGLSKQHRSDFVGISIEMSIANRLLGRNGSWVEPIFLNHIQNLRSRAGKVAIRIGGNSQEKGTLVPTVAPFHVDTINKTEDTTGGTTNPPILTYSEDLLNAMATISNLVETNWYFGLPFLNEPAIANVADRATQILGPRLLGMQLANEPDLYLSHARKPAPYGIPEYMADWQRVRDANIPSRTDLIAPNVCCGFKIDAILAAGFLTQFGSSLRSVSVQHYLENACPNSITPVTPEAFFASILTHNATTTFMQPYIAAAQAVNAAGKDFVLMETNTASCGGFAGASDSFGAALYLLDLSLQAAFRGFSQVMLHNGGVGQYYNLFTPPQTNQSMFRQWTTGSPYYTALIMSEAMAKEGSQVVDLGLNNANPLTPGYAIYHGGQPNKLALFNFVSDGSGANDMTVSIAIGGGATGQPPSTPAQIHVKYFRPPNASTGDKFNLTWAEQTMGDQFSSDGRLKGTHQMATVDCPNQICNVQVKAPSFALVFLTSDGLQPADPVEATQTFASTIATRLVGTIAIPPDVLATSNGRGGAQEAFNFGGTSFNRDHSSASSLRTGMSFALAAGFVSGILLMMSKKL